MSKLRAHHVLPLLLLLTTGSACGSESDSETASDPAATASTSIALEAITSQGIAGVVRDALGDQVVSYSAAGESDNVGVVATLTGRQVLSVSVQTQGEVPITSCDDLTNTAMGAADCAVSEDGTITSSGTAEAFSDDNTKGSTVLAQSVNPKTGRVVYALYETYSPTPSLDPATVAAIVSDPALAAMTDPATNAAGADIDLTAQSN